LTAFGYSFCEILQVYMHTQGFVKININIIYFGFSAARAVAETDIALYIGLSVALVVFLILGFVVIRMMRRKGRDHVMYDMAPSGQYLNFIDIVLNYTR